MTKNICLKNENFSDEIIGFLVTRLEGRKREIICSDFDNLKKI